MGLKKLIYVIFIMIITSQIAYADYYTQSLSLGGDKNEYSEKLIKTSSDDEKNTQSAIIEYVQPIVYPVQYYSTPQIITFRNYPSSYFNYNRGGLSIGYNSHPSYHPSPINPPSPIHPIKPTPHPPIHPGEGTRVYKVGPSYGKDLDVGSPILSPPGGMNRR